MSVPRLDLGRGSAASSHGARFIPIQNALHVFLFLAMIRGFTEDSLDVYRASYDDLRIQAVS